MVHFPRSLRTVLTVSLILVMVSGLAACTLSASDAPTIDSGDSQLPVPGDDSIFDQQATQTPQTPGDSGGGQAQPDLPAATATLGAAEPAPTNPPQADNPEIKPTEGPLPASYTLQKGEFPFCIARRFNVNQTELLALNGLTLDSKPGVGFTLRIPQTGNHFVTERSLKSHPTTYTVSAGDTIYTVACKFGDVSPDMIALANGLDSPYTLSSGQQLSIP